jgi:hypothetical protein
MKGQGTNNRICTPGRTKGAALARYKILPYGFWLPPRQSARVPPKKLRSKSFRLLPRTSPAGQVCINANLNPLKAKRGRRFPLVSPKGNEEGRGHRRGSPKATPASFGPSPALRLLPSRALSSVTAVCILTPPALAAKRKIPGDTQGGRAPLWSAVAAVCEVDVTRQNPYIWGMEMLPLTPERKAQLDDYAQRHGQTPAEALDELLADALEWERQEYDETVLGSPHETEYKAR